MEGQNLGTIIRNSLLLLIIELIGTLFLTLLYNAAANESAGFVVGMWVITIFGSKLSGSHFNPAISLGFMIRRDTGKFPRFLGIAYIISQVIGALAGAFIWLLISDKGGMIGLTSSDKWIPAIFAEFAGSFFFVFFFLTQTEESTKFSKDLAISSLIIAAGLVGARAMSSAPSARFAILNPAVALANGITLTFKLPKEGLKWIWIFAPMPFVGAIVAVIFYELIFKKVQNVLNGAGEGDEDEANLLDDK